MLHEYTSGYAPHSVLLSTASLTRKFLCAVRWNL
jgi:hypothetical protein